MGIFGEAPGVDYDFDLYEKALEKSNSMIEGLNTTEKLILFGSVVVLDKDFNIIK